MAVTATNAAPVLRCTAQVKTTVIYTAYPHRLVIYGKTGAAVLR